MIRTLPEECVNKPNGPLYDDKAIAYKMSGLLSLVTEAIFTLISPIIGLVKLVIGLFVYALLSPRLCQYFKLDHTKKEDIPVICAQLSRWIYMFSYMPIFKSMYLDIPKRFGLEIISILMPIESCKADTSIGILRSKKNRSLYITFQGTNPRSLDQWITNFTVGQEQFPFSSERLGGKKLRGHSGFLNFLHKKGTIKVIDFQNQVGLKVSKSSRRDSESEYDELDISDLRKRVKFSTHYKLGKNVNTKDSSLLDIIKDHIYEYCKDEENPELKYDVYLAGHSQGGALALMTAYNLSKTCRDENIHYHCFQYGAPRVLNDHAAKDLETLPNLTAMSFVYNNDLISRMLPETRNPKNHLTSYHSIKNIVYFDTPNWTTTIYNIIGLTNTTFKTPKDVPWNGVSSHLLFGIVDHNFSNYVKSCNMYKKHIRNHLEKVETQKKLELEADASESEVESNCSSP